MITLGAHSYHGHIENSFDVPIHIGKFTSIASGLRVVGSNHPLQPNVSSYPFKEMFHVDYTPCDKSGEIHIENDVWIGESVIILQDITIHSGAVIGAGALISKDVEAYTLVVGNPQVTKKHRFEPHIIEALLRISWWQWDIELILSRIADFKNVYEFVEKYG